MPKLLLFLHLMMPDRTQFAFVLQAAKLDVEPFSYIKAELKNADGKTITRSKQCTANGFVSDGIEWDPILKVGLDHVEWLR